MTGADVIIVPPPPPPPAQVTRSEVVVFFNEVFDALCKLTADSDPNVQSAAHLLDRLVKVPGREGREAGREEGGRGLLWQCWCREMRLTHFTDDMKDIDGLDGTAGVLSSAMRCSQIIFCTISCHHKMRHPTLEWLAAHHPVIFNVVYLLEMIRL